jgi:thiol-disulfide isomerase/thioredoxin
MGTWCPNCTDENKLFTEWYSQLSSKVQIIALAVERTNNSNKAIQLLQNYKTKLNIPYPIVLLSEKGNQAPFEIFPQLIKIPAFPTTIYFNKELKPVFATMGFNGPATNELYLQTQQHIKDIIQQLQ